jgi:serine protease
VQKRKNGDMNRLGIGILLVALAVPVLGRTGRIVRVPERVDGVYLVVLDETVISKAQVPDLAKALTARHGGAVRMIVNNTASIFSASLNEVQAQAIAQHPAVLHVEEVGKVYLSEVQPLPPPAPLNALNLWNLDRIDQWGTANSNAYQFCERGRDVIAYMADMGVMGTHQEFQRADGTSRVRRGVCFADDCVENRGDVVCPDQNLAATFNHGTAVASILGGRTVGAAKDISIVPLRIFACGGDQTVTTTERFCWALDWIRSANNPDRNYRPALVSLSAYTRANDPLLASFEHVINGLVRDDPATGWTGITVIASANNQGRADCVTSPARMAYRNAPAVASPGHASPGRVISVGGTSRAVVNGVLTDVRWQGPMYQGDPNAYTESCFAADGTRTLVPAGSNHGNMVDIYAPADDIESADSASANAYRTTRKSGTSFSAPLVAGIAARILQVEPSLTPQQVWTRLQQYAQYVGTPFDTSGVDQNGNPTSNNRLAIRRYSSTACTVEYP